MSIEVLKMQSIKISTSFEKMFEHVLDGNYMLLSLGNVCKGTFGPF